MFDLLREIVLVPAWECCLVVRQRCNSRPDLLGRCSEDAEHAEELIDFGVALEERLSCCHFSENATDGPDINGTRVALASEKDFGRAIPQSHNFMSVVADWNPERAAQSKVGNFDDSLLVDQQVLRLK